jgi:hypothetical protein
VLFYFRHVLLSLYWHCISVVSVSSSYSDIHFCYDKIALSGISVSRCGQYHSFCPQPSVQTCSLFGIVTYWVSLVVLHMRGNNVNVAATINNASCYSSIVTRQWKQMPPNNENKRYQCKQAVAGFYSRAVNSSSVQWKSRGVKDATRIRCSSRICWTCFKSYN